MKFKPKGDWKSLPMPHSFFTGEAGAAMCGGIEVLTDYTINSAGKVVIAKDKVKSLPNKKESLQTNTERKPGLKAKKRKIDPGTEASPVVPSKRKSLQFSVSTINTSLEVVKSEGSSRTQKNKKNKKKGKKPAIDLSVLSGVVSKSPAEIKTPGTKLSSSSKSPINKPKMEKQKIDKPVGSDSVPVLPEIVNKSSIDHKKSGDSSVKTNSCSLDEMEQWRELFVCEEIVRALADRGFQTPTPIQRLSLPAALKGRMDIVAAAETGSGKTLAFAIPIVQGICQDIRHEAENKEQEGDEENKEEVEEDNLEPELEELEQGDTNLNIVEEVDNIKKEEGIKKGGKLRALILTPTRELAMQIRDHIQAILKYTELTVAVIVGGMSVEKQLRLLKRRPSIVVATPGRLWDLVQEGVDHLTGIPTVRYLAVDEADRMSEKGHFEELGKILEMMRDSGGAAAAKRRQTFLLSATLSMVHKAPAYAKGKKAKGQTTKEKLVDLMEFVGVKERRKVVDITRKVGTAETLTESIINCSLTEKDIYLYYFITAHRGRTIVFCNSIDCVRRLANLFTLLRVQPLPLHAQLHQKQRLKNLDRFAGDSNGLLIATDVAARGLDIPNIEHVVHYQVPRTSESYVHRSGRTARANKQGLSVLLIDPTEQTFYRRLCGNLARNADLPTFPVDNGRYAAVAERMEAARRLDKLLLEAKKKNLGQSWKAKAAEEADLILSDDDDSDVDEGYENARSRESIQAARLDLDFLLRSPLVMSEFSASRYPTMAGSLPQQLQQLRPQQLTAVETLTSNITNTEKLLRGTRRKKPANNDRKFKGFKKKKGEKKNRAASES